MSEWISVEDRLPEDTNRGLTSKAIDLWDGTDKARYADAYYFKGKFWDVVLDGDGDFSHYFELENVTHWMPLPEPPK